MGVDCWVLEELDVLLDDELDELVVGAVVVVVELLLGVEVVVVDEVLLGVVVDDVAEGTGVEDELELVPLAWCDAAYESDRCQPMPPVATTPANIAPAVQRRLRVTALWPLLRVMGNLLTISRG